VATPVFERVVDDPVSAGTCRRVVVAGRYKVALSREEGARVIEPSQARRAVAARPRGHRAAP
jgi:hypothetical protein